MTLIAYTLTFCTSKNIFGSKKMKVKNSNLEKSFFFRQILTERGPKTLVLRSG